MKMIRISTVVSTIYNQNFGLRHGRPAQRHDRRCVLHRAAARVSRTSSTTGRSNKNQANFHAFTHRWAGTRSTANDAMSKVDRARRATQTTHPAADLDALSARRARAGTAVSTTTALAPERAVLRLDVVVRDALRVL